MDFSALNRTALKVFGDRLPVTIDGVAIEAVYDSRHYAIDNGEAGASDLITSIAVLTSVLPPIDDDTVIVARGISYRVFERRPDGEGMTTLILERRS